MAIHISPDQVKILSLFIDKDKGQSVLNISLSIPLNETALAPAEVPSVLSLCTTLDKYGYQGRYSMKSGSQYTRISTREANGGRNQSIFVVYPQKTGLGLSIDKQILGNIMAKISIPYEHPETGELGRSVMSGWIPQSRWQLFREITLRHTKENYIVKHDLNCAEKTAPYTMHLRLPWSLNPGYEELLVKNEECDAFDCIGGIQEQWGTPDDYQDYWREIREQECFLEPVRDSRFPHTERLLITDSALLDDIIKDLDPSLDALL